MFFNANEASVYRASLAQQQGIVVAGCKSSSLEIRRISLLKATRSALKIEMIFEGGMTRRDSRHCPQFLDSGNSSEFSISGGPVCSKARDSVLYEQSFLAGFPLILQPGINYPPSA